MLLIDQEVGGINCFDKSEWSAILHVDWILQTFVWIGFPIDASAFVDSMDFTHQQF